MAQPALNIQNDTPPAIIFTDSAANKVFMLIQEEENPSLSLRVYISGGGCSGFQYGFTFEETINSDDIIIEKSAANDDKMEEEDDEDDGGEGGSNLVRLLCDPLSFQYLEGATIDYVEDINGAQFVIRNPNAKTTCGCGSSFSV